MKKTFRGFIAIEVPNDNIRRIAPVKKELGEIDGEIKPVEDENLHITLKFLGEANYDDLEKIETALHKVAEKIKRFKVRLNGIGVFPNESYIRVVWIGCDGIETEGSDSKSKGNEDAKDTLKALADNINMEMGEVGFPKEENTPHVTIARIRRKIDLSNFLTKYKNAEFGEFEVSRIFLKQSILGRDVGKGPKYETLVEISLE
ncbi:TPA: RNA 2',3'-cyclic phosphodiesterase [Candidatus Micrarchaeota archaeon]|nr:RNA 2',3'-cyclic phosphodiesterase [Candidatus Micrarchaeota archaeon]